MQEWFARLRSSVLRRHEEAGIQRRGARQSFLLRLRTVRNPPPGFFAEAKFRQATWPLPSSPKPRSALNVVSLTARIRVLKDRRACAAGGGLCGEQRVVPAFARSMSPAISTVRPLGAT